VAVTVAERVQDAAQLLRALQAVAHPLARTRDLAQYLRHAASPLKQIEDALALSALGIAALRQQGDSRCSVARQALLLLAPFARRLLTVSLRGQVLLAPRGAIEGGEATLRAGVRAALLAAATATVFGSGCDC
jgi:hypothetical protein